LQFHPTKNQLATSSGFSRDVLIWDLSTNRVLRRLAHPGVVFWSAWSPDGEQLATGCGDGDIYLWDLVEDSRPQRHVLSGHELDVLAVGFFGGGDFLWSASYDSSLRFWDASTGKQLFAWKEGSITFGGFAPSGYRGLFGSNGDNRVGLFEFNPARECR